MKKTEPSLGERQYQAWQREYEHQRTIESSTTSKPEACIAWFQKWLSEQRITRGRLLDVGCGLGRNSIPFLKKGWSVTAQDMVGSVLAAYAKKAQHLPGRLTPTTRSIEKSLPYKNDWFHAVLEITVADNLINDRAQRQFWRELARVTRPGGYLLSYYFTAEDGFYGRLLKRQTKRSPVVLDKTAGMAFRFYTAQDIVLCSEGLFQLWQAKHYRYPGPMHGKHYQRDLIAAIFKKVRG